MYKLTIGFEKNFHFDLCLLDKLQDLFVKSFELFSRKSTRKMLPSFLAQTPGILPSLTRAYAADQQLEILTCAQQKCPSPQMCPFSGSYIFFRVQKSLKGSPFQNHEPGNKIVILPQTNSPTVHDRKSYTKGKGPFTIAYICLFAQILLMLVLPSPN